VDLIGIEPMTSSIPSRNYPSLESRRSERHLFQLQQEQTCLPDPVGRLFSGLSGVADATHSAQRR
jgi:hypothetical protein